MMGIQPRGFLLLVPVLMLGCPDNSSSTGNTAGDTDTDTDGDTDAGSTSMTPTTDGSSSSTTGPDPTDGDDSSSTTSADDSADTSTGEPDETTGGVADGICIGLDPNGSFVEVLSRNDAPVEPTCSEEPAPCAGDLLGTWTYADTCGEDNLPLVWGTICPEAVETVVEASIEGTLTFNDDATYQRTSTTTITTTLSIDALGCLEISCLELEELLSEDEGVTATCIEGKAGCDCEVEAVIDSVEDGMYESEKGELTLLFDGEESGVAACVTGDRLDLWTEQYAFAITDEACADEGDCVDALGDTHALYFCEPEEEK